MMLNNKWIILVLCAGLFLPVAWSYAADDEESKVVEAADGIIKGLPDALKAGLDFSKMTPDERVNWVLTSVESKVQDDIAGKFQDKVKEKLEEYAKEAIRAKAFMDIGVPQIRGAYTMGKAFDWSKIDAEISSSVDTKMAAIGAGIKTAQISWNAISAYQKGNFRDAAKSVGGEISDMLAEAYIPGYGYIKVGVAMVEFLGNYVLDYATDTAVAGMLNDMYGMKSDPQGLAQWVIDKSPSAIMADINDKFNDGMGFGYLFKGQGADKGDEEMKVRIQQALVGLRTALLQKKKEAEQKEQQMQQEIEQYLAKYRASEKAVQAAAEAAKAAADSALGPVRAFKANLTTLRKEDVQDDVEEIEGMIEDANDGGGEGVPYVPLNRSSLVSEFEAVYAEIKDTATSGYDAEVMYKLLTAYWNNKQESIGKAGKANQDNCNKAVKAVDDRYVQPLGDLYSRALAEKNDSIRIRMWAQYNALNNDYQAERQKRFTACSENKMKLGLEITALKEEENIVKLEAQERADKASAKLSEGFQRIADGIENARRERDEAQKALTDEIYGKFSFPNLYFNPNTVVAVETCSRICGPAESIKNGTLELYAPGALQPGREQAIENIEKLKKDLIQVNGYVSKEKDILKKYQAEILQLHNGYDSLLVERLRNIPGNEDTPEAEEQRKSEDERVQKYGTASALLETWGVQYHPYVTFKDIPALPAVEKIRYFDQQLTEMDKLEQQRKKQFDDGLKNIQEMLSVIDYYADLDRIALSIKTLAANLNNILGPYLGAYLEFRNKDGKQVTFLPVAESDGAKKLQDMKDVWAKYKSHVERLRGNVNAYGNGLKYVGMHQSPDDAIAMLARFESIPGQIAAGEKRMAEIEKQNITSQKMVEDELAGMREDFIALQDPDKRIFYLQTLKGLRSMFDQIFKIIGIDQTRLAYKEDYIKLRDEVEEYVKKRTAEDKEAIETYNRAQEEGAATRLEAERRQQEEIQKQAEAELNAVKELYDRFKETYESRNDAMLMSFLADDWESGDGATLSDLQDNFARTFRAFDEIRYVIQNMHIVKQFPGEFLVSYDVTITSRIYSRNIKHEEKSSVSELVKIADGKAKIIRTLNGRFWYVE